MKRLEGKRSLSAEALWVERYLLVSSQDMGQSLSVFFWMTLDRQVREYVLKLLWSLVLEVGDCVRDLSHDMLPSTGVFGLGESRSGRLRSFTLQIRFVGDGTLRGWHRRWARGCLSCDRSLVGDLGG